MGLQTRTLKLGRQLTTKAPLLGVRARRAACQKLAADGTAQAVPFLVSALESDDEQVRRTAEQGLESLTDPEAVEALALGYAFTKLELLGHLLTQRGRSLPEETDQWTDTPSPAQEAWRFLNSRDGTLLAFIPEGGFRAGKDGFWTHRGAYYLAFSCVTNAQYARFLTNRRPSQSKLSCWTHLSPTSPIRKDGAAYIVDLANADLPVVWVTWEGAAAYCRWAGLRLPTELEWEKGARGGDGRLYPWGNEWEGGRNRPPDGEQRPEVLDGAWTYPAACSPYGLFHMVGNVYEWCADWYEEGAYQRYSKGDLRPPAKAEHRALRGGPWCFGTPVHLRTEYRKSTVWRGGTMLCGFRCAMTP